jgi:AraC-like DNA-binding protein
LIPLEIIIPDNDSSFRVLHHKVKPEIFTWNFHYHPEVEIVFVFDGIGRRHVGNHLSYYENGDLVIIGSNLPHSGFGYGALGIHEEVVIQFNEDCINALPELNKVKQLLEKSKVGISFNEETRTLIKPYMLSIISQSGVERYFTLLKILLILANSNTFEILNREFFDQKNFAKSQKRIKDLLGYIDKNYMNEMSTNHAAELCNMTKPAFCNYFKKKFDKSFTDFLNEYRVNQACLMLNADKNISEIAYKCGFNSLSYFSRTFKKIKNVGPRQFCEKNYLQTEFPLNKSF